MVCVLTSLHPFWDTDSGKRALIHYQQSKRCQ